MKGGGGITLIATQILMLHTLTIEKTLRGGGGIVSKSVTYFLYAP